MVRAMHEAGIEVILDVVYNHTAEGNHLGPTIAFRGIDNAAYYRLEEDDRRYYTDYTGTGNSLNVRNPHALQLIMDSLRYWVLEMRVDGFRFDLAATLAREFYDVDRLSSFFELVQQDPVVSQVKLIAEPWDVGPGGYQVGNFPPQWSEWNGKYRDVVRDFWRGEPAEPRRVRVAHHRFGRPLREQRPQAGRLDQLRDRPRRVHAPRPRLVQREAQRRQRRGRQRRRIAQPVVELGDRGRHRRSRGAPCCERASSATSSPPCCCRRGCRCSRTATSSAARSSGNNNTYAQDNELSWVHWDEADQPLVEFTAAVARLRKDHPTFRRSRFFDGRPVESEESPEGAPLPDIVWLRPDGTQMRPADWDAPLGRAVGVYLNGERHPAARRPRRADHRRGLPVVLQRRARGGDDSRFRGAPTRHWDVVIDTAGKTADSAPKKRGATFKLEARSMLVLRAHSEPEIEPDHSVAASLAVRTSQSGARPPRGRRSGDVGRPAVGDGQAAELVRRNHDRSDRAGGDHR